MKDPIDAKVICLGFQKTGTSSFTRAMKSLGMRTNNVIAAMNKGLLANPQLGRVDMFGIMQTAIFDRHVLQDSPCAFFYREFDLAYPQAKFVLLERSLSSWLASFSRYFADNMTPLQKWMYGVDKFVGNEAQIGRVFEGVNQNIRDYFLDRPDKLLCMNIESGDGYPELIPFLGRSHCPPFPKINSTGAGALALARENKE